MRPYKFLVKPVFYIVSIFTACWLVLVIERMSPSQFGKYKYVFESPQPKKIAPVNRRQSDYIKKICLDFKYGRIDSARVCRQIDSSLGLVHSRPQILPQKK